MLCSKTMYTGIHRYPCRNTASVTREGTAWCKIHDPEKVRARRAAREAAWKLKDAESDTIQREAAALAKRLGGGECHYYSAPSGAKSGYRRALVVPFDLVERILARLQGKD